MGSRTRATSWLQELSNGELVGEIGAVHRGVCLAQRALMRRVVELDTRELWEQEGCYDAAHWVARFCGLSSTNARLFVNAAHALERLPHLSAAFEEGEMGLDKVLQLARFATEETEQELIKWARRVTVATVREKADLERRIAIDEMREAHKRRRLSWRYSEDGLSLSIFGELAAADGAVFVKAVTRQLDKLPEPPPQEEDSFLTSEERFERKCADALMGLCMNEISRDPDADRATVVVHTTLSTLESNSKIEGGPEIHPAIAERLRCDARLRFVLTDQKGNPLGIGYTSRNIPQWLFSQLKRRDRCCTFPGCGRKAFVQGHHILKWPLGPTDLDNLTLVCHFHHRLLHEFDWRVELEDGVAVWWDPFGRRAGPELSVAM